MKNEFIRYGLAKHRRIVGILQFIGGISLLIGVFYSTMLALAASTGLALIMILGYGVRIKIRDPFLASFPALFYAAFNSYLAYRWLTLIL
ncbi:hypothetical protein GCM10009117_08530 [Gangjinia marincola]|uniref:Uncharacterized protein n=2 Tax=Gangjinia marincola TaxID=578463 RepID=A0ABN1MEZ7_9FLAO